jgi:hypothetical protein
MTADAGLALDKVHMNTVTGNVERCLYAARTDLR